MAIKPNFTDEDRALPEFDNTPVIPGTYEMEIFKSYIQRSKADTKTFLTLGLKHTGDERGPAVWDMVSVEGVNAKGDPVSLKKLGSLFTAIGLPESTEIDAPGLESLVAGSKLEGAHAVVSGDTVSLIGKRIKVKLGIEKNLAGESVNVVQFNYQSAE